MNNCFNFTGGEYDLHWWLCMVLGWFIAIILSWNIYKLNKRVKKLEEKK